MLNPWIRWPAVPCSTDQLLHAKQTERVKRAPNSPEANSCERYQFWLVLVSSSDFGPPRPRPLTPNRVRVTPYRDPVRAVGSGTRNRIAARRSTHDQSRAPKHRPARDRSPCHRDDVARVYRGPRRSGSMFSVANDQRRFDASLPFPVPPPPMAHHGHHPGSAHLLASITTPTSAVHRPR